jgi:hypothetical protein
MVGEEPMTTPIDFRCPVCGLKRWDAGDLVPGDLVCVCGDPFFDATKVPNPLLADVVESLERVGCQFDHCTGPTLKPVDMMTCHRCDALGRLRSLLGLSVSSE